MSLLHQESPEELDDAALGEEFTKGSSHVVWAAIIAAVVVTLVLVVFAVASRKPPAASGEIVQVWAHPRHVETSGLDANGAPMPKESFDEVLLFAHVKLKNDSKYPLVLENALANVSPEEGILSVSAGSVAQFQEAVLAYPNLAALHTNALSPHMNLAPDQSVDGTIFWVLRFTRQQWDARKDWGPDSSHNDPGSKFGMNFTFSFQYQPSLVLAPQTAVMEQ